MRSGQQVAGLTQGIPDPTGATQRAIRALNDAITEAELLREQLEARIDELEAGGGSGGAVSSVTAGSSAVTVAPTTGDVVVDVDEANFSGIPQAAVTSLVADLAGKADAGHTHDTLANVATSRILGRVTAGSGDSEELTGTQATTLLDTVTTAAKGLVPTAPNDTAQFLRGDATWSTVAGINLGSMVFGSGHDGDANFNGVGAVAGFTGPVANVYTQTRVVAFNNVAISAGVTLNMIASPMFIKGTLSGSGTIRRNGNNGTATAAGAALSAIWLPGSTAGGYTAAVGTSNGGASNTALLWSSTTAANGVAGAVGTTGGVNQGSGGGGHGAVAVPYVLAAQPGSNGGLLSGHQDAALIPPLTLTLRTSTNSVHTGPTGGGQGVQGRNDAAGGGAAGSGGGGGGGGGTIMICAYRITFTGIIEAKGGNGGPGTNKTSIGGGGGGGGGGGNIILIRGTGTQPATLDVSGGTGGAPGTGAHTTSYAGANGGAGKTLSFSLEP